MAKEFNFIHFPAFLQAFDSENKWFMSVTLDTSHSPIEPCEPLEQSPCGDNLRHAPTALFSSVRDCGENAESRVVEAIAHSHLLMLAQTLNHLDQAFRQSLRK